MKFIFAVTLLVISAQAFSQAKTKLPSPPNCVWLYENLFIDKTEIANIHWLEYLHFLYLDSSRTVYRNALPDTTVWDLVDPTGALKSHYLRDQDNWYLPVVGVTLEQATKYCTWRSNTINKNQTWSKKYIVSYRLPTEAEWEYAAYGGLDRIKYPFGFSSYFQKPSIKVASRELYPTVCDTTSLTFDNFEDILQNYLEKGVEPNFNVIKKFPTGYLYSNGLPWSTINKQNSNRHIDDSDVNKFSKNNQIGVSDMIGNVAEMVIEKGIAKGGSWIHTLEQSAIRNKQTYTKPELWFGFRCVCEVGTVK